MAKRTTKRTSKKEYTLAEFKAWLEGIEELQPANWAPDANQWKTIRDKLMNIVEEVSEAPATVQTMAPPPGPIPREPVSWPQPAPAPASPMAMPSGSALADVTPEMTPAAAAALSGKLPSEMVPSSDGKVKTPNIDTADGNYGSSFE